MKRLLILAPLCLLAVPAHAVERHDWRVVKTADGAYAYDTESVETDIGSGEKSVSITIGARAGNTTTSYDIDCEKNRGQITSAEQDTKAHEAAWSDIPKSGAMKIAADVACVRHIPGAIHVKSEKAALAKLKILSK